MTPTTSTTACAPICSRSTTSPRSAIIGDIVARDRRAISRARAGAARARSGAPPDHPHDRGRHRRDRRAARRRSSQARPPKCASAAQPLVAFSPAMQKADAGIKGFLYPRMYRHDRVMRVMEEAEGVLRDLFAPLCRDARRPAGGMGGRLRARRRERARAPHRRLHRRHDRPLRADRARQVFQGDAGIAVTLFRHGRAKGAKRRLRA